MCATLSGVLLVWLSCSLPDGMPPSMSLFYAHPQCLYDLQQERGGRDVPTGMLYGTVVEHIDMSVAEMQSILVRLIGHKLLP
jgi:hypothetical protein